MQRSGRWWAVAVAAALVMTVGGAPGTAAALPAQGALPDRSFASSFEAGERAPDWQTPSRPRPAAASAPRASTAGTAAAFRAT